MYTLCVAFHFVVFGFIRLNLLFTKSSIMVFRRAFFGANAQTKSIWMETSALFYTIFLKLKRYYDDNSVILTNQNQ